MKAYKVTLLIIDHDGVGENITDYIENQRFPNDCLNPHVMDVQEADIGEWDDDHPLNKRSTQKDFFETLFKSE